VPFPALSFPVRVLNSSSDWQATIYSNLNIQHVAVTVWSPRWTTAFTLFLNDQVPILYGCTYGDDKCEQSTFKVSVWQKGAIFSGHVDDVGIVTPRTYWTTWKIPKTLTPGGYFYFYIDNGNGYTQSSSYFEIRRQGFYLDTPDVPSIWVPNYS
jgi:hypothetical protein